MEQQVRGLTLLAFAAIAGLVWVGLSVRDGDQTLMEISGGVAILLAVVGVFVLVSGLVRQRR